MLKMKVANTCVITNSRQFCVTLHVFAVIILSTPSTPTLHNKPPSTCRPPRAHTLQQHSGTFNLAATEETATAYTSITNVAVRIHAVILAHRTMR
jgi:hypothetical protein